MGRPTLIAASLALMMPMWASAQFGSYWSPVSPNVKYDDRWTFTRLRYHPNSSWNHDYPRADRHLAYIVGDVSTARVHTDGSNVFDLDDPQIFRHPLVYMSEPGFWDMTDVAHPIFHAFFDLKKIDYHHPMYPGMVPDYKALFENNDPAGRMMALANHNNDLAEYWEWSDTGMFAIDPTNEAYRIGVNYVIYSMTH